MSYADFTRQHRRLAILRYLEECPAYTVNASILGDVLARLGLAATHDQIVTEITWLQEQGFVSVAKGSEMVVATATRSGLEIARGLSVHPEIRRPRPEA